MDSLEKLQGAACWNVRTTNAPRKALLEELGWNTASQKPVILLPLRTTTLTHKIHKRCNPNPGRTLVSDEWDTFNRVIPGYQAISRYLHDCRSKYSEFLQCLYKSSPSLNPDVSKFETWCGELQKNPGNIANPLQMATILNHVVYGLIWGGLGTKNSPHVPF